MIEHTDHACPVASLPSPSFSLNRALTLWLTALMVATLEQPKSLLSFRTLMNSNRGGVVDLRIVG